MSIFIQGVGVVSPAGWGVNSIRDALAKGASLPIAELARPGWKLPLPFRPVPAPVERPAYLSHSRLRRTSPISQFVVGAALEALGDDQPRLAEGSLRLGIIVCVMAGCVRYSRRFYEEVCRDPRTASPLVFPETVFNAPASHLAAVLGSGDVSYTLVGDPGMFLVGLALGASWLSAGHVEGCLVVGAEESDWLISDASRRFERRVVLAEGAGAVYLRASSAPGPAIALECVTDAHSFTPDRPRARAAAAMRAQLPQGAAPDLLCDGTRGQAQSDAAEEEAWAHWPGARLSVKRILGESWAAGSAWQCVAAADALRTGRHRSALVSVVGCNQQAIGLHLGMNPGDP
ncbi:MAG: hypothetical protein U1G07_20500 [Verrucomicrobiota bacterium]